jgi:hypothetical protein
LFGTGANPKRFAGTNHNFKACHSQNKKFKTAGKKPNNNDFAPYTTTRIATYKKPIYDSTRNYIFEIERF